jgi:hypothetical protein
MAKKSWTKRQQAAHRRKWIKALRSGKYEQTTGRLRLNESNEFCCLGVACDISGLGKWDNAGRYTVDHKNRLPGYDMAYRSYGDLPTAVVEWLGLNDANGPHGKTSLAHDNDARNLTFNSIANIIEREPKGLIKE